MALFIPSAGGPQGPPGGPGPPGPPGICVVTTFGTVSHLTSTPPITTGIPGTNSFDVLQLDLTDVNSNPPASIVNPFVIVSTPGTYEVRFSVSYTVPDPNLQILFAAALFFFPSGPLSPTLVRDIGSNATVPQIATASAAGFVAVPAPNAGLGIAAAPFNVPAQGQPVTVITATIYYQRVA